MENIKIEKATIIDKIRERGLINEFIAHMRERNYERFRAEEKRRAEDTRIRKIYTNVTIE
jgi:hypothetical protein